MNVASQAVSKELYELSGWYDTSYVYARGGALAPRRVDIDQHVDHVFEEPPAYDLGFLLRKLPPTQRSLELSVKVVQWEDKTQPWAAGYYDFMEGLEATEWTGSSPEDAICRLAIDLFKQGILPAAPKQTKEK